MSIKLLYTTAWHPRTDGQSESMIQTIEVGLCHWLVCYPERSWQDAKPDLITVRTPPSSSVLLKQKAEKK
jgi:hypothetical protein